MNRALWRRALIEARPMTLACGSLLFGFCWLFVWLTNKIDLSNFGIILGLIPEDFQKLSPIPVEQIATYGGRIVLAYVDPVVIFTVTAWGIARGSDAVSGELGRGTLEMVLAQPVRRSTVLLVQATVTTLGGAVISLCTWLGLWAGLSTVTLADGAIIAPQVFLPAAMNLFGLAYFLAAYTTLLSSFDRYRARTIGIAMGIYVVSLIVKLSARMAPELDWMKYASFLTAFEPQLFVNEPATAWSLAMQYTGVFLVLGTLLYGIAIVVFAKRDLPAPL